MNTSFSEPTTSLSRRQLLQRGLLGSALLSTASLSASLSGCTSTPTPISAQSGQTVYRFLRKDDIVLLAALAPAIMDQHWPQTETAHIDAMNTLAPRIDRFIMRLGDFNIREMRKLFDLLNSGFMRGLTTGIWRDWNETDREEVHRFLQDWKFSRFALFNSAYNALSDIIGFAWYSMPANSGPMGYSGPPAYVIDSLPQFKTDKMATGESA